MKTLSGISLIVLLMVASVSAAPQARNILLITVDDMNCDSAGVYGCEVRDVTPHIDKLASQGMRFKHGHVTIAICQPTRAVWMTGRYPHNNGAFGFDPIRPGVPTLPEALKKAGFYNGLMAKHGHVIPTRKYAFHQIIPAKKLRNGRSPELYYQHAKAFFEKAKADGRRFFLMANSQDPHRPFAGSAQETKARKKDKKNKNSQYGGGFPDVEEAYKPAEITVPGFLPDLPNIRKELAEYYTSVRRADAIVGAVLRALEDAGLADSTIVVFLSDHGMPLPFAKTNVWRHSTRTPYIVRWPGVTRAGHYDEKHLVSGIDLAPTLLDACGVDPLEGMDGRSFVSLLKGKTETNRTHVFTMINTIASKRDYSMRSVQDARYGYIYNAWVDGTTKFKNESQSGLTFKAMQAGAQNDAAIAARVQHFVHRTPEEFYDYEKDPDALNNLASKPEFARLISRYRNLLRQTMNDSNDPLAKRFKEFAASR